MMKDTRTAHPGADADVAHRTAAAALEPGARAAAALAAAAWRLDDGMAGARTLAAATGARTALGAAVALAAAAVREDAAPPAGRAGGARRLTREYSYLLSSYTAEACEPLPVFNTLRGAGVAGDDIRHAQPGIEYVLLVRDHGTTEWRTAVGGRTIPAAIAHHWGES